MGTPETGNGWLVQIDDTATPVTYAARATANWVTIGGQRSLSYGRTLGTADVTDKDSDNNEELLATNRSAEVSLDNLLEADDDGLDVVEKMYQNRETRLLKLTNGTISYVFAALCTEFPIDAPQDDAVTSGISFKRTGPEDRTPAL